LWFVGIADDPGDAWESGQLFGRTLRIAACGDNADGRVGGVKLSNGAAGLGIGGGCDSAGVNDDDIGGRRSGGGGAATVKQLALEGGAVGLRGAATELLDEEAQHLERPD